MTVLHLEVLAAIAVSLPVLPLGWAALLAPVFMKGAAI